MTEQNDSNLLAERAHNAAMWDAIKRGEHDYGGDDPYQHLVEAILSPRDMTGEEPLASPPPDPNFYAERFAIEVAAGQTMDAKWGWTALHEAGHAVYAHAIGRPAEEVVLETFYDDDSLQAAELLGTDTYVKDRSHVSGWTKPGEDKVNNLDTQQHDIMLALAGHAAVRGHLMGWGLHADLPWIDDDEHAFVAAMELAGSVKEGWRLFRHLRAQVEAYFLRHEVRYCVIDLSDALLRPDRTGHRWGRYFDYVNAETIATVLRRNRCFDDGPPSLGPRRYVVRSTSELGNSRLGWTDDWETYDTPEAAMSKITRLEGFDRDHQLPFGPRRYDTCVRVP